MISSFNLNNVPEMDAYGSGRRDIPKSFVLFSYFQPATLYQDTSDVSYPLQKVTIILNIIFSKNKSGGQNRVD